MENRTYRILLIPYYFAPSGWPRSIRWSNIAHFLAEKGHHVTVISASFPETTEWIDPSLNKIVDHNLIHIHRIQMTNSTTGTTSDLRWLWQTLKKAMRLNLKSYDVLITSALPIWSHFAGSMLRAFRKAPLWIADYGDPWALSEVRDTQGIRKALEIRLERIILRSADAVTITTSQARRTFEYVYPNRQGIYTIPQGASLFHLQTNWRTSRQKGSELNILYTGGLHKDKKDPRFLFEALKNVDNVRLTIIGTHQFRVQDYVEEFDLHNRIGLLSYIALEEIVQLQNDADILLLIGWSTKDHIPGKFFEYLSTNKPILYITNNTDDSISQTIRELGVGHICLNEPNEIIALLSQLHKDFSSNALLARRPIDGVGFDQRADQYLQIINQIYPEKR